MPDEPGPHTSRHVVWTVTLAVAAVAVAVSAGILGSAGGSSTRSATSVLTAPATTAASVAQERLHLEPGLRPVAPGASCGSTGRVLRVLQLNIHFGIDRGGALGLTDLADEIQAAHADLVSLNEVDDGTFRSRRIDEVAYLAEATGLHGVYGPNLPWQGGLFGNAILSRFPVVASRNLQLPHVAGLEQRGLLTATVRVGGRPVSFSSVHLSDGPDGRASRILEARAVERVVRDPAYPTILAGDLNSGPHALPVRVLRQHLLDAQEQGGTGDGDTIPEPDPQRRIDYVLYDDHLAVVPGSTHVLPSSSSDHRSVLTELSLLPSRCVG